MSYKTRLIIFIASILFSSLPLHADTIEHLNANHPQSVSTFLSHQKIIRVFVDEAPGFGNQTASQNVMNRLRQLGFHGRYELIYGHKVIDKVTTLFGLPVNIPPDYFDPTQNIRFIQMKNHVDRIYDHTLPFVALSITGANDSGTCSVAQDDGVPLKTYDPLCIDGANLMGTAIFAELSPYIGSPQTDDRVKNTFFEVYNPHPVDKPYWPEQEDSYKKYLVFPFASWEDAKDYLDTNPDGQTLLRQKPSLKTWMDGVEQHAFNSMSVYGYTVQLNDRCPTCYPGNILQIIAGARYAQLHGTMDDYKPLVIPVFFDYQKEANTLLQLVNSEQWGIYEQPGADQARAVLKSLQLQNALFVASVDDATTVQKIQSLQPGQILLLSLGSLPKVVFDGLYNHMDTNIWPAIREGANSFNTLILTGKPHIRCAPDWEIGFDLVNDPDLKNRLEQFYSPSHFCDGMNTWNANTNTYQSMGNFIIEAQHSQNPFPQYFNLLQQEALQPENDRIYYAIEGVIQLLKNKYKEQKRLRD